MRIRPASQGDLEAVVAHKRALWPDGSAEEHRADTRALLEGRPPGAWPLALFVADDPGAGACIGFVEVGLRSHADGCDPTRPCGFVEGWYVAPEHRRRGVGGALIARAEAWARARGCVEMASDTWIDADLSQRAHEALGFEVVDRCVNFRKALNGASGAPRASAEPHYGADLARVHHERFGLFARAAARELLGRLARAGRSSGTVVDLGAGTGISSHAAAGAGFDVVGVDLSEEMLRIARAEPSGATFVAGSLWSVDLPRCVAVAAIGEAMSYAADAVAGAAALEKRLGDIHDALLPGGLFLFDVAGPGRSGPGGARRSFFTHGQTHLGVEEHEDAGAGVLSRAITLFVPAGGLHRRVQETHWLRLYAPADVERSLSRAGFAWEPLHSYDDFALPPGVHAWAATRRP